MKIEDENKDSLLPAEEDDAAACATEEADDDGQAAEKPVYRSAARRYAKKASHETTGKTLPSRKKLIGIVSSVVVVAAALVCFLAFFLNRQQPIEGSWKIETSDATMYLTIYEDNTVIVTTGGYNVDGTVERREGDVLSFQVAMATQDVLSGDYRYRCTKDTLTLTQQQEEGAAEALAELIFTRLEKDATQVEPPQEAEVDPAVVGVWSDEQGKIRYTFQADGVMRTDLLTLGVSANGTYSAKDGLLTLGRLVDGRIQNEETEYAVNERGNLMIGKIEFIKEP